MNFRRVLASATATAAIAAAPLLAAPAASAADGTTAATTASTAAGAAAHSAPTALRSATAAATTPTCLARNPRYRPVLRTAISGLPTRIATGSGWHKFTLTIDNPSGSTVAGVRLFSGISSTDTTFKAFRTNQVTLQAYFPNIKRWVDVKDTAAESVGFFGTGRLPGHTHLNVPMRVYVKKTAPAAKGMVLGAGFYADAKNKCTAITAAEVKVRVTR
ncbi:hypothetical protein [Streptantibioticus cattleyicolor]|uniref:Integral membrane protein n=1 Tax=Streptantibioticus cattleyicolor (strain ATCC 35852 / DSM 46488 / JCM 4925 / NBRC 14057 / NRRL 8057) TaxID=1003195 RepID=F8JN82_STREN|nr:hypothetical protein [Streptantibioticus cattleyicolor]AEW99161.1 integral membrane protein [Streptantibioticus cattleyicolor NRRL 8057 = DSM 46488]CCB71796.1 exported protein of unknown function [Streptantibioticus cattleyicolor NRRL 8057 = DSM 46488]